MCSLKKSFLAIGSTLLGGLALMSIMLGCGPEKQTQSVDSGQSKQVYEWKMVTTWLPNFPGLGTSLNRMVKQVETMSNNRLRIKVYGAGELVKAFGVFDAVQTGVAQMGHGAAYYWYGKIPEAVFFTTVPFGMTAQEMNAWIDYGGGLQLWRKIYGKHGIYPIPGGNTGVQMAGWFRHEVKSIADIKGIKMRIPGLGGEVFRRAGGTAVSLPGDEVFIALQTGAIDAAEWIGPYNDLAFGFYTIAKYYYYPGWHEPGPMLEVIINQQALDELPDDLRAILESAVRVMNQDMLNEFTARSNKALKELVEKHDVQLRRLPDDVLLRFKQISHEILKELALTSEDAGLIYESFTNFQTGVRNYYNISEKAYLEARDLSEP